MSPKKSKKLFLPESILVLTHYFTTGNAVELKDYLGSKTKKLYYIRHPFAFALGDKRSSFEIYRENKLFRREYLSIVPKNEILLYLKDLWASLYFILKCGEKIELCVAANNLNTLAALILKRLGKIKKVIYYNVDYTPQRFNNKILNSIYRLNEKFCCYHADANWVGTELTVKAREAYGVSRDKCATTVIVPDGNHSLKIKRKGLFEIETATLVYAGHILKKQGLDLVLESLPELKKQVKGLKFLILGTGEHLPQLKKKAKKLNIDRIVEFKGYIEDHAELEKLITKCALAVATYIPEKSSVTFYSEAGKPKLYLGCGLPVVITKVPTVAKLIDEKGAGIAIDYDKKQFVEAVLKILKKKKIYEEYKQKATRLGLQFDWSEIFEKAFKETKGIL